MDGVPMDFDPLEPCRTETLDPDLLFLSLKAIMEPKYGVL